jgi:hypothetical protein
MKKLLLTLCITLAFPIAFSGSNRPSSSISGAAYAQCNPEQQAGNFCVQRELKPSRLGAKQPGSSNNPGADPLPTTGVAILAVMFLIWMTMRR